jgi:hypothetical protein
VIRNIEYDTKSQNISTIKSYCHKCIVINICYRQQLRCHLSLPLPQNTSFFHPSYVNLMCIFRKNIIDLTFLLSFLLPRFLRYSHPALIIQHLFPIPGFGDDASWSDNYRRQAPWLLQCSIWDRKTQAFKLGYGEA